MKFLNDITAAGLSFLLLAAIFWPLEKVFPANKKQRLIRAEWWTDLTFFLGQYLLWGGLMLGAFDHLNHWINTVTPSGFRAAVASQPIWLQIIEVIFLSDFMMYWGHRLQHKVAFLWRFHSIHHNAEHLDWMAGHREHPLDGLYTLTMINLPAAILGFPIELLGGFTTFRAIWAIYIHSNVRLPLGPFKFVLGAPEIHHWHHSKERESGNYADVCPLMDVVFGTYRCPNHEPESLGVEEPMPRSYLGQLLHPFKMKKAPRLRHEEANKKC